ncbi:MAG: CapA family protein [Verrucomicrobia bacterium]|nr:CapA family protein [Verrucomicrobiota bacterium]MCH8527979.1 CapA family protein [Kiritimatiellia bacterium]
MSQPPSDSFTLHAPEFRLTPDGAYSLLDAPALSPRLLIAGDWASIRIHEDAARRSPEQLYGGLAEHIAGADLSIVNLECVLGGETPVPKDGPNLKGDPESARALKAAGFDLATLANNHMMDYGTEGMRATLDACRRAGLASVGAGDNEHAALRPAYSEVRGLRVGVLNLSDREDGEAGRDTPGVADGFAYAADRAVRDMRDQSDFCLVIAHGGKEYVPVPSLYWYEQLLRYALSGADMVVAHHPHVPQGITWLTPEGRAPVPVIFSTGNFVFRPAASDGANIPPHTADGYLVEASIETRRVAGLTLRPYLIQQEAGPRPLDTPRQLEDFRKVLEAQSEPLTDPRQVAAWFDAACDWLWTRGYRERLEGLTAKLCVGDLTAARHARNHHHGNAHLTLIDHMIARMIHQSPPPDPVLTHALQRWFTAGWRPEPPQ